jgi:hypothetical protein
VQSKNYARNAFSLVLISALTCQSLPAHAAEYDAVCGGVRCRLILDGRGFAGPSGFIPTHRIAQWYTGGGEERNVAASAVGATGGAVGGVVLGAIATCWSIILCPIGLIGGGIAGGMGGSKVGKSADFYFTVIGYNQSGNKITQSFNFLNKKPAARMIQELPAISGLGMGELRSVEEIRAGDARAAETGTGRPQLPATIERAPAPGASKALPANLNDAAPTEAAAAPPAGKSCWSSVVNKPEMAAWAAANTSQAAALKKKYADC